MPSRSGIYRALVRQNLIQPKARRRQRKDYKRWERSRSMELWQMDVVGRIYLSDGTALSAVTGIDDHSRFCVIAKLVSRATARPVCDALLEGFSRHGIPESILTDNGRVFTAKASAKSTQVLFDRICHHNGVKHILTAPVLTDDDGQDRAPASDDAQGVLQPANLRHHRGHPGGAGYWVIGYNTEREHQSIGDVPPIRRFELRRAKSRPFEVIDGDVAEVPPSTESPTSQTGDRRRGQDQCADLPLSRRAPSERLLGRGRERRRAAPRHSQRSARRHPCQAASR